MIYALVRKEGKYGIWLIRRGFIKEKIVEHPE
jgi:hypothetical protein